MKKIFITGFAVFILQQSFAQDVFDALRFSYLTPTGSARVQAIGGANISLGGDISSTFLNPAGLAQFKTNELVLSPGLYIGRNKLNYNDSSFKGKKAAANLGVNGFIFSWGNRFRSSNIRNTTVSIAINQSANFNSNFAYSGRNTQSSYSEKWVEELAYNNVFNLTDAENNFPAGASQAYVTYLIDTIAGGGGYRTNANTKELTNIDPMLDQSFSYETRGGMHEAAFAMAWNMKEKFLYGVTIGIPMIDYRRKTTVSESDASNNPDNDFKSFTFSETFSTKGSGFNAKLGVIFKPVEYFRIGLSFHTPSVISLTDNTNVSITSDIENYARRISNNNSKPSSFTDNTHNITGGTDYTYGYQLVTPWRMGASMSYVFREINDVTKQKAFITADVELVNYKGMSYSTNTDNATQGEKDYFESVNQSIDALYKMAFNAKIGGELKFETFMVRAGFNYTGSPYNKETMKSLPEGTKNWRMTPSLGIGYRDKGFFADLTYAHTIGRDFHVPYMLLEGNGYPVAKNNLTNGQIMATVGFKF